MLFHSMQTVQANYFELSNSFIMHCATWFIIWNIVYCLYFVFNGEAINTINLQTLTVEMINLTGKNSIINQMLSKTNEKHGFNSLLFSVDGLTLANCYMNYI